MRMRRALIGTAVAGGLLVAGGLGPVAAAADPPTVPIARVEQDWEVVLNEPGEDLDAPQFHTVIAPGSDLSGHYGLICWNFRGEPLFSAGGLQVQLWDDETLVSRRDVREDKLSTAAETVTWTQYIATNGSLLAVGVKDGHSTTWGDFGGAWTVVFGVAGIANLNGYSTATSVANSWISYGANRVDLMRIVEVRYYDAAGHLVAKDTTPHVVYELE